MTKPSMLLKWADEPLPRPISRADAAHNIRKNRSADPALQIEVKRRHGDTFISSRFLGVGCVIYKDDGDLRLGAEE